MSGQNKATTGILSMDMAESRACYTAPLALMFLSPGRTLRYGLFILFLCANVTAQDSPNPFTPQATRLVDEIMGWIGSAGFVTLNVANRSSLDSTEFTLARKAIEARLLAANVRLVKPERAVAEINVTLSENLQGLLWVADIKQGTPAGYVMVQGPNVTAIAPPRVPAIQLRRTAVYAGSDDEPMLDFVLADAKSLYVLRSQSISNYKWDGARWSLLKSLTFERSTPAPRDVRGRLVWQALQITAYLPGLQCTVPVSADGLLSSIQCREVDDPWQLDNSFDAFFSSNRNFFSGIIRGANLNSAVKSVEVSLPPFYSAAAIGDANATWAFTGTDGRVRVYSSLTQSPHVYAGWGSDMASVHTGCGSAWQLLISKPGDRSQPDAVQAMEIVNGEPSPASSPLDMPGSVTSMWRSADGATANVITRDAVSRRYEASTLTIDCR